MSLSLSDKLTKVRFEFEPSDIHHYNSETLWAEAIGNELYILKNSPLYARGYSYLDTVLAIRQLDDDIPIVTRAVKRSGHSTFWVIRYATTTDEQFEKYWKPLSDIGCTLEGMKEYYFAVDIPPEINFEIAFNYMRSGEDDKVWTFAEGFDAREEEAG